MPLMDIRLASTYLSDPDSTSLAHQTDERFEWHIRTHVEPVAGEPIGCIESHGEYCWRCPRPDTCVISAGVDGEFLLLAMFRMGKNNSVFANCEQIHPKTLNQGDVKVESETCRRCV